MSSAPGPSALHKRVSDRELSGTTKFKKQSAYQRFSKFRLEAEHDTHDPDAANLKLSFLRRRSKIVEIISAGEVVFALTLAGVCAAFSGKKRIAFLNTTPDEVVRSLFYNKANQSIITVSVYRADNFSSLKCRTCPIEYLKRGKPDAGFPLFESECLKWPGFVEFDDVRPAPLPCGPPCVRARPSLGSRHHHHTGAGAGQWQGAHILGAGQDVPRVGHDQLRRAVQAAGGRHHRDQDLPGDHAPHPQPLAQRGPPPPPLLPQRRRTSAAQSQAPRRRRAHLPRRRPR